MPRQVDEHRRRAALRRIRKAADLAERGLGPPLSDWEKTFLEDVAARIATFGSAFADPSKGQAGDALSGLQQAKLREIGRKAGGRLSERAVRKGPGPRRPRPEDSPGPDQDGTGEPDPAAARGRRPSGWGRRGAAGRNVVRLKKEEN